MSFTDDENKRIEDEELKAEKEIRSKFQSMFSKEELEEAEKGYRESILKEKRPASLSSRPVEERKSSGRVVKKVDVDSDPILGSGSVSDVIKVRPKTKAEKPAPAEAKKKTVRKQAPNTEKRPTEKRAAAAAGKPAEKQKERIRVSGPGYSMSGHRILTDSNYEEILGEKKEAPVRRQVTVPETYRIGPGIRWFRQDIIPPAGNELTRSDQINATGKVKKRARRVERAGEKGTRETIRGAQVSVFSAEARMEASIVPEYYEPDERDFIVAKGKVNPNTARISRDTVNRMLEESEPGRQRKVSQRKTSHGRPQRALIRSVDNSRKTQKRRQKQNKPAGPGGKIAVLFLVALAIALCIFGYSSAKKVFNDAAMDPEDLSKIEYTVYDGTTDEEVGEFLVSHGLVESTLMYKLRAKIFDAEYVAGTYELSPSYSTEKIINILSGFDYSSSGS